MLYAIVFALFLPGLAAVPPLQFAGVETAVASAHKEGNFDGVVVVSQEGRTPLTLATGFADRTSKTPNRPETLFRLGSLTKQVTALMIMQEVTSGHLRLDQKAGELVKGLSTSSGQVTVRQLLQHVSGLRNPSDGPDDIVPPFYLRNEPAVTDMTRTAKGYCSEASKRSPGQSFEYNNCDYIVLGAVLEAITGKSYEKILRERVTEPLGLKSWGLFPSNPARAPRTAKGYREDGTLELPQNPATYGAAGGLYGTALDVAKWNTALLTNRVLSADATAIMFQADPKLYGEALGSWSYDLPGSTPPLHLVERQGDIGSTRLLSILIPARSASIVIIANTDRTDLFNTYSKKGLGYELLKVLSGQ